MYRLEWYEDGQWKPAEDGSGQVLPLFELADVLTFFQGFDVRFFRNGIRHAEDNDVAWLKIRYRAMPVSVVL